jgi:DNA-binding transcriptional LysR family regulator
MKVLFMDLKSLRYFLAVSRIKNITKAAEQLHISQPTLSRQLIFLEESLGVSLFIKGHRTIELTSEGTLFQQRAREILDLADKAKAELSDVNALIFGTISIGCIESKSSEKLFDLMKEFSKTYRNVTFQLISGYTDDLLDKMNHGIIDICMLLDPVDTSEYNVIRLPQNEEWGILFPHDDDMSQYGESIDIKNLVSKTLMFPTRPAIINEIENWFGKEKYHLSVFGTYNLLSTAIQCAERSICYPICLNNSQIENNNKLLFKPLNPSKTTQSLILWKKSKTFNPATKLFVNVVNRTFNPLSL